MEASGNLLGPFPRLHLESGCILMQGLGSPRVGLGESFGTPDQKTHIELSTLKIMHLQGVICILPHTKSACGNRRHDLRASA